MRPNRRTLLCCIGLTLGGLPWMSAWAEHSLVGKESHALGPNWPAPDPTLYPQRCQISSVAIGIDGNQLLLNRGENSWLPTTGYKQQPFKKQRFY